MATIEPRLMHLLNPNASPSSSESSSYYPSTELPPLQSFSSFAKASNISLPPLEPDAGGSHDEKPASKTIRQIPSLASIQEEYYTNRYSHDGSSGAERSRQPHTGAMSLRKLFDNPEVNQSSHSLNHILDDVPEPPTTVAAEDGSNKKRGRGMTVKEDIMHLPQPLKKQKSTQNMMSSQNIMPPIINGLYEPPPNAAVFPPIALEDGGGNEAAVQSNLSAFRDFASGITATIANSVETPDATEKSQSPSRRGSVAPTPEAEKPMAKIKRKAAKPRKKWSEEETRDLLLGVNRYGVGKWTSILEDAQYRFNGRTAGDLKDRFRTCCPDELRIVPSKSKENLNPHDKSASSPVEYRPKGKLKTAIMLEDILAGPDEGQSHQGREDAVAMNYSSSQAAQSQHDSDSTTKPKKSRAHRKKIEDLQAMGIHGPFKKSHRRERRPFTQQDDDQILEGLGLYGPAWTKIQRDPRFDLSTRQPTDLRDRVRNKYPEMYKQIEEKQVQNKEPISAGPGPAASHPALPTRQAPQRREKVLEPSVSNMINENSSLMTLEPHLTSTGSREEIMMPKWAGPTASGSAGAVSGGGSSIEIPAHELSGLDYLPRETLEGDVVESSESSGTASLIGMMDISRLLLDG